MCTRRSPVPVINVEQPLLGSRLTQAYAGRLAVVEHERQLVDDEFCEWVVLSEVLRET